MLHVSVSRLYALHEWGTYSGTERGVVSEVVASPQFHGPSGNRGQQGALVFAEVAVEERVQQGFPIFSKQKIAPDRLRSPGHVVLETSTL